MSMIEWAEKELSLAGYPETDNDDMNDWMRKSVLDLLKVFINEGHSGSSAPYAVGLFTKLASWKPLTALTGKDDEWIEVGDGVWQNKRAFGVFKDADGNAYWGEGIVFWEWWTDPVTGNRIKTYFTSKDSRVPITFPFTMPDKPEYRERVSNDKNPQPE